MKNLLTALFSAVLCFSIQAQLNLTIASQADWDGMFGAMGDATFTDPMGGMVTFAGAGPIVTGNLTVENGIIVTNASQDLTTGNITMPNGQFQNNGTLISGSLTAFNNSQATNGAMGNWTVNAAINLTTPTTTFTNNGTMTLNADITGAGAFTNSGGLGGTSLTINGMASYTNNGGATTDISGPLTIGPQATFTNQIGAQAGFMAAINNMGGTLTNRNIIITTGALINEGTINNESAGVILVAGALNNSLQITNDGPIYLGELPIVNSGTITNCDQLFIGDQSSSQPVIGMTCDDGDPATVGTVLNADCTCGEPAPIPTVGEWGIIALTILLMIIGIVAVKKEKTAMT